MAFNANSLPIFGSIGCMVNPKVLRKKSKKSLDNRKRLKVIVLGISTNKSGFTCMDLEKYEIVFSRDVKLSATFLLPEELKLLKNKIEKLKEIKTSTSNNEYSSSNLLNSLEVNEGYQQSQIIISPITESTSMDIDMNDTQLEKESNISTSDLDNDKVKTKNY